MTLEEYFGQGDWYFSESAQRQVPLDSMNFQRAFYSHCKLLREFGNEYNGTTLSNAFVTLLCPSPEELRSQMRQWGKVCHMYAGSTTEVRSKLYSAFKSQYLVSTHKVPFQDTGTGWIEAERKGNAPDIRVKAH